MAIRESTTGIDMVFTVIFHFNVISHRQKVDKVNIKPLSFEISPSVLCEP